ncbi:hypothetical protein ACFOET_15340 [Parapedobacter deserti]|uniref:Anti-sigma factor n=1 Tax=Parapedobacter deserti TaxID=1912957 RepID=A0ABV7JPH6_9SPHI
MNEDLKTFITENRAAFDHATPPGALWQRIADELDRQQMQPRKSAVRKMRIMQVLKIAALTFLVGTTGIVIYFLGKKQAYEDYSQINPELAAVQQVYAQLVTQKKDSIAYIASSDPLLYNEFSDVLLKMEANYEVLKREFSRSPNKELTLGAMIRNLQAQIQVLSQQMEVLKYIDGTKKQTKHEQI